MAEFMQIQRQGQRDRRIRSPLEEYTDEELIRRYHFDRHGLRVICELVEEGFPETTKGGTIPIEIQVCAALAYLASNSFQIHVGDTLGISQQSVSNCVKRFCSTLAGKANQFIFMPIDVAKEKRVFSLVAGFPNVVGLIDGTHVHIQAPSQEVERDYVNRKNRHSINVQVVVNTEGQFTNVVARHPGCTHDSHILRTSLLWDAFQNNEIGGILLGDSGYPCKKWLMTPFLQPSSPAELRYNKAHKKTRVGVEQRIGQWKRRFSILHSEVRLNLENVVDVVLSTAVLHNLAIELRMPEPEDEEEFEDEQPQEVLYQGRQMTGIQERNRFVREFLEFFWLCWLVVEINIGVDSIKS